MKESKYLNKLLLLSYLVVLIWIILFKFSISLEEFSLLNHSRSINLSPFAQPSMVNGKTDWTEIIYNALIFLPFGGLLGIACKKTTVLQKLFLLLATSLGLEIAQYILAVGATDITDVIVNVAGGCAGLFIYWLLTKLCKNEIKLDRFLVKSGALLFLTALTFVFVLVFINR